VKGKKGEGGEPGGEENVEGGCEVMRGKKKGGGKEGVGGGWGRCVT